MRKIAPCFCLNLENILPLPIFFPVESELQKCVISLAWWFRCCFYVSLWYSGAEGWSNSSDRYIYIVVGLRRVGQCSLFHLADRRWRHTEWKLLYWDIVKSLWQTRRLNAPFLVPHKCLQLWLQLQGHFSKRCCWVSPWTPFSLMLKLQIKIMAEFQILCVASVLT